MSNVRAAYRAYPETLSESAGLTQAQLDEYFTAEKSSNLYGWMDLILNGLLSFHHAEKKAIRKHVKHDGITTNTFMRYFRQLMEHVEKEISTLLPDTLALVMGGWTCGSTHYFAVFVSLPTSSTSEYDTRLLTISPCYN